MPCSLVEVCRRTGGLYYLVLFAGFLLGLHFDPEGGGRVMLQNICELLSEYTVFHPRRMEGRIFGVVNGMQLPITVGTQSKAHTHSELCHPW
jgi:hypothetical protein